MEDRGSLGKKVKKKEKKHSKIFWSWKFENAFKKQYTWWTHALRYSYISSLDWPRYDQKTVAKTRKYDILSCTWNWWIIFEGSGLFDEKLRSICCHVMELNWVFWTPFYLDFLDRELDLDREPECFLFFFFLSYENSNSSSINDLGISSFLYTFLELETLLDDLESSTNSFLKWMKRLRLGTMFLLQGHLSLWDTSHR